ncbi:cytochrome P450 [Rhizophagus irregularis DAOM 181602=DAOM 197198]|nr:cytochrome P450 [Rhizophagus irregularis DAOM 181602=DAOM 197198]
METNLDLLQRRRVLAIILGSLLFITLYILKRKREPELTMPPLVSYKFPIIGHTFDFFLNPEKFLKQCREEYGDIFCLYIWGQVRVFVGKEHFGEVYSRDDVFDVLKAFNKRFPIDVLCPDLLKVLPVAPKTLKDTIFSKLKLYSDRMQKRVYLSTQKHFGDCDESKIFYNLFEIVTKIISDPIANIIIGEEESQHEEVLNSFANFIIDSMIFLTIPPFLDIIYPGLQEYVNRIQIRLGLYNPADKHRKPLLKHIEKQVRKRLQEKEKYGDSWKRPDDHLQDLMEEHDPNNISCPYLLDRIYLIIFASIHTTAIAITNVILSLASRPEYMQELYEEQLKVHKETNVNGIIPFEALSDMKKLDSFIRETLRLSVNVAGIDHLVKKDYTFSNGLQIPKNCITSIYIDDVYRDEPKSFEPFRHLDINIASKVTKNFLTFGNGKHACPGRQLAVNNIKFFMHNVILKYNFRTVSSKIEESRGTGFTALPVETSTAGVIFEKRV